MKCLVIVFLLFPVFMPFADAQENSNAIELRTGLVAGESNFVLAQNNSDPTNPEHYSSDDTFPEHDQMKTIKEYGYVGLGIILLLLLLVSAEAKEQT